MKKNQILMCPPTHYGVKYEINPWMKMERQPDSQTAQAQWEKLFEFYEASDIEVHLADPVKGLPDMVFAANAGLVHNKDFIPSNFRFAQRQSEKEHWIRWFEQKGYKIHHLLEDQVFEGQGDALFLNDTLFAGYRFRSDIQTHRMIGEIVEAEVISLELIDPRFYHLDTCFCPLGENRALFFPGAFDEYGIKAMRNRIENLIEIDEEDAARFCCNAVVLQNWILMNPCSQGLKNRLRKWGLEVFELAFDQFIKAGGSAKCLSLVLG